MRLLDEVNNLETERILTSRKDTRTLTKEQIREKLEAGLGVVERTSDDDSDEEDEPDSDDGEKDDEQADPTYVLGETSGSKLVDKYVDVICYVIDFKSMNKLCIMVL